CRWTAGPAGASDPRRTTARHGAVTGCCGTCVDARGLTGAQLVEGARRSTLDELTDWTLWADRVITF
ncbi:DsrE family protein, partial [Streptomyces fradiae]|uniref:DsrE family protein n=1 Tax=Streptomyces fradiae TaxID=1906 RepID=UPI00342E6852